MLRLPEPTTLLLVLALLLLPAIASAEPVAVTAPTEVAQAQADANLPGLNTLALRLDDAPPGGFEQPLSHVSPPENSDGIGPGSRLHISRPDGQFLCTAAFVFQHDGDHLLGTAGHCLLPAGTVSTHGHGADYDPSSTSVRVCVTSCTTGGSLSGLSGFLADLGDVVYARQTGSGGGVGNDFGLVQIPPSLHNEIRAGLPTWGGPTTSDGENIGPFDLVCHHGNGVIYGEWSPTKSRIARGQSSSAHSFTANGLAAGGDSGSAVITCTQEGAGWHGVQPAGILTHGIAVIVAVPGLFFGTNYNQALDLASEDAGITLSLVTE